MITSATLSPIELFQSGEPGIYPGIPSSIYHGLDAVSNSRLKPLAKSALHCRHAMLAGVTETDALKFGSGAHAWCLEPETLERDFVVAQQCAAIVKSTGKVCTNGGKHLDGDEWFCGTHGKHLSDETNPEGVTIIPQSQWDEMAAIRDSIHSHPAARAIMEADGDNELSILATHPLTQLACKLRLDIWRPGFSTIADIKTCQDASEAGFKQSLFQFGYFRQAGMYLRLAQMAGLSAEHFVFIAVEKKAPHAVAVYRLQDDVIEAGWGDAERLMHEYASCQTSGNWPGYSNDVADISLNDWDWKKLLDVQVDSE